MNPDVKTEPPTVEQWAVETVKLAISLRALGPIKTKTLHTVGAQSRKRLEEKRRVTSATQWWRTEWKPKKIFSELPQSSQRRAFYRRIILVAFYAAVDAGATFGYAELAARGVSLAIFGKAVDAKTIRRTVGRIETCGGPDLAPLEAYADCKSVPHPRSRKPQSGAKGSR
jgi:hypothetical protein